LRIEVTGLTTCSVDKNGEIVELNFVDALGNAISLRLPFENAQAIAMTLPRLLTLALQRITGEQRVRYAFPLGGWSIEDADENRGVITTFATEDGFEVSFDIPLAACQGLGWTLQHEADERARSDQVSEGSDAIDRIVPN
jgi:hypothetical protein